MSPRHDSVLGSSQQLSETAFPISIFNDACIFFLKNLKCSRAVVAYAFKPNTREAEGGRSL